MLKIVEKDTGIIIGQVATNQSLTFDEACRLAGLKWKSYPDVDTDGWYKGDTLWDESVAEIGTDN
jgi:hypothetical protein